MRESTKKLLLLTVILALIALTARLGTSAEPDLALLIAIKEAELRLSQPPAQPQEVAPRPTAAVPSSAQPSARVTITEATLPADQQPTPMEAIGVALRALPIRGKTFVDIGCGFDCRAGIVAARDFGAASVIAIEIDPATADSARRYVEQAGLADRIQVVTADAAHVEFPAGAVGFGYLWPDTLAELRQKIEKLSAFASFAHAVPGLRMQSHGDVFVYERPTAQSVLQTFRQTATWNGRQYSHPVCSRPNCAMCNAIRRQLASTSKDSLQVASSAGGHWETRCTRVGMFGRKVCQKVWVAD